MDQATEKQLVWRTKGMVWDHYRYTATVDTVNQGHSRLPSVLAVWLLLSFVADVAVHC